MAQTLSHNGLPELLADVESGVGDILATTQVPLNALLDAVMAISTGLDLDSTLHRIVQAAVSLVGAESAALELLDGTGKPRQLIQVGSNGTTSERTGLLPNRHDVLDEIVKDAAPPRQQDVSGQPMSVGCPPHHRSMTTIRGVPIRARGRVFGHLYLTEKTGGQGYSDNEGTMVLALAAAAGVAIDNALLYERARHGQRWLEATREVTNALLTGIDTDQALMLIANHAHELIVADYTLIAVPDHTHPDAQEVSALTVAVCIGASNDTLAGRRIPVRGSTTGAVFTEQVPRNVTMLAGDIPEGSGLQLGPSLASPLGAGDPPDGVLLAIRTAGSPAFDDDDLELLGTFADQAALALQRTESQAAQCELDVHADRDRIARDLHDHVIGRLSAVGRAMHSTQRLATTPDLVARLNRHIDELDHVIGGIRTEIVNLHTDP